MAKFLFIYREPTESRAKPSPEEMQALQAAWYTWMQKFSSAIVPRGDGLKRTGRVLKAGLVTDGPYVEAKEIIVSFGVIQADDYDAALAIARACPPGHTIEIREFAGYARANRARWRSTFFATSSAVIDRQAPPRRTTRRSRRGRPCGVAA